MFLIKPSHAILNISCFKFASPKTMENFIEGIGRICYKSEEKIHGGSAKPFIKKLITSGHESVIEHGNITVKFICDRGVTHELVRHRLVSYSQESTRYCNYKGGITFIIPPWVEVPFGSYTDLEDSVLKFRLKGSDAVWFQAMWQAEKNYQVLIQEFDWSPQQARSILPNSLKTEIVATANLREWRHILRLRTSPAAHPQMVEIMKPLLLELKQKLPTFFEDLS